MEIKDELRPFCTVDIFEDENGNRGIMPVYKTKLAACADVALPAETVIKAGEAVAVDLLLGFDIPRDMKVVMYPRSSLLIKKHLIQPVSIIDADYSHMHVHVPLYNPTDKDITLAKGERVGQLECVPRYDTRDWEHEGIERTGGLGSTGK